MSPPVLVLCRLLPDTFTEVADHFRLIDFYASALPIDAFLAAVARGRRPTSRRARFRRRAHPPRRRAPRRRPVAPLHHHRQRGGQPHRPHRVHVPRRTGRERRRDLLRRCRRLRCRPPVGRSPPRLRRRPLRPAQPLAGARRFCSARIQDRREARRHHRPGQHPVGDCEETGGVRLRRLLPQPPAKGGRGLRLLPDRHRPRRELRRARRGVHADSGDSAHRGPGRAGRAGERGVVVNVARGANVDEAELVRALAEGRVAGAGLEVFEDEPNVPRELMAMDNVVLTPHQAIFTPESMADLRRVVVANLDAFFAGEPLLTRVQSSE